MTDAYDETYFLRGREAGVSLYTDYRWLPGLTVPMCRAIAAHLRMRAGESVLDFGCARGYVVRAFRELGYAAWGYDISRWAVENGDSAVRAWLSYESTALLRQYDWVLAKDVLEHLPEPAVAGVARSLARCAARGILVVVPLSPARGEPYMVPEYELDVTHQIRLPLGDWADLLAGAAGAGWAVETGYRLPGVKDNYYDAHPTGNGFLTLRRQE